jgi:hypothetical protein
MKRNLALATVAAASALALTFGTAASALTTYTLGSLNTTGYPAPYGTVTVDLTSPTMATVTFTAGSVSTFNYYFIDGGAADVNVNATTWTITNLTTNGVDPQNNPATLTDGGSGQVDGWGTFNQTTTQSDGYGSKSTSISFILTDTSGNWDSSSDNVLTPNALGNTVGAHIAVCDTTDPTHCAQFTGFATNGTGRVPVPEPATWALMLVGFGGLGAVLRSQRRRQRLAIA